MTRQPENANRLDDEMKFSRARTPSYLLGQPDSDPNRDTFP